jgi:hypothetical protein
MPATAPPDPALATRQQFPLPEECLMTSKAGPGRADAAPAAACSDMAKPPARIGGAAEADNLSAGKDGPGR